MSTEPITPAQIDCTGIPPLTATFGRTEREVAAAMLVLACTDHGSWYAAAPPDIGNAIIERESDPAYRWLHNPFCRPDFHELVAKGFAEWVDGSPRTTAAGEPMKLLRFTDAGIAALAGSRWVKR